MRKRDFHHKRVQKQKTTDEWVKYKKLPNKTTSLIRNAKQDYYSDWIEENKKDSSKLWKTLKSIIATNKMSTVESLETGSGVIQDSKKISQSFAKYFSTAIVKLRQRLPVYAKILEKAVHEMVYNFLLQHKLQSYQSAFRPLHSTATSLIDVTNTIVHIIEGKLTGLAFLDLSKAFDSLIHELLLTKLAVFGLSKSSVNWFNAYLTNRTQPS